MVDRTGGGWRKHVQGGISILARYLIHPWLLIGGAVVSIIWFALNLGLFSGIHPWAPLPIGLIVGVAAMPGFLIALLAWLQGTWRGRKGDGSGKCDGNRNTPRKF